MPPPSLPIHPSLILLVGQLLLAVGTDAGVSLEEEALSLSEDLSYGLDAGRRGIHFRFAVNAPDKIHEAAVKVKSIRKSPLHLFFFPRHSTGVFCWHYDMESIQQHFHRSKGIFEVSDSGSPFATRQWDRLFPASKGGFRQISVEFCSKEARRAYRDPSPDYQPTRDDDMDVILLTLQSMLLAPLSLAGPRQDESIRGKLSVAVQSFIPMTGSLGKLRYCETILFSSHIFDSTTDYHREVNGVSGDHTFSFAITSKGGERLQEMLEQTGSCLVPSETGQEWIGEKILWTRSRLLFNVKYLDDCHIFLRIKVQHDSGTGSTGSRHSDFPVFQPISLASGALGSFWIVDEGQGPTEDIQPSPREVAPQFHVTARNAGTS